MKNNKSRYTCSTSLWTEYHSPWKKSNLHNFVRFTAKKNVGENHTALCHIQIHFIHIRERILYKERYMIRIKFWSSWLTNDFHIRKYYIELFENLYLSFHIKNLSILIQSWAFSYNFNTFCVGPVLILVDIKIIFFTNSYLFRLH